MANKMRIIYEYGAHCTYVSVDAQHARQQTLVGAAHLLVTRDLCTQPLALLLLRLHPASL